MTLSWLKCLSLAAFLFVIAGGCGSSGNQSGATSSELQQYIEANPDKVNRPEDMPVDEQAEFAAGNG